MWNSHQSVKQDYSAFTHVDAGPLRKLRATSNHGGISVITLLILKYLTLKAGRINQESAKVQEAVESHILRNTIKGFCYMNMKEDG